MKKKIIGISLVLLAITGIAFASGTGIFITPFVNYTQIQSIAQTSGYPINVYKVQDKDANCYITSVGNGFANISCVPVVVATGK